MERKITDIVPLTFPKLKPQEAVGMYLLSKKYEKEPKCYPETDCARETIGLNLILAKRHEHVVNKRLVDKRLLSIKKRESFNEQYKSLEDKEASFQTVFRKFNKFVRENQEKRERAEKKIVDERALQQKRDNDIETVKENIQNMTEIKSKMDQRIKEYRMFEDYLQGVVKQSSMFKNINDIIIRYEALLESKNYLGERQNRQLASLESARADMAKLLEEKNLVLIGLNNQLSELQIRYETAKCHSLQWETLVSKIQDITIAKADEIRSAKVACWNTYKNMCERKGIEPKDENNFEAQLLLIKNTITEVKKVYNTAKRAHFKDSHSMKAEHGSRKSDGKK